MSHGREAARDLVYGRRGGAWASDADLDDVLHEVQRIRLAALREHKWPIQPRLAEWQEIEADPTHPYHRQAVEVLIAFRGAGPPRVKRSKAKTPA